MCIEEGVGDKVAARMQIFISSVQADANKGEKHNKHPVTRVLLSLFTVTDVFQSNVT